MGIEEDTRSPMRGVHQLRTPGCREHSGGQGPGLSSQLDGTGKINPKETLNEPQRNPKETPNKL